MEDGKPPLKLPYNLSQNPYEAATKFIQDNEAPITYLDQVANFIIQNTQGASLGQPSEAPGADPWGSEDRYRPGDANISTSTSIPATPKKIPQKDYLSILAVRVSGVQKKLSEINAELIEQGHKDISMNPSELKALQTLCSAIDPSGDKKLINIPPLGLDLVIKLCTAWPYKSRLPALDLLRILAVSPSAATYAHPRSGSIADIISASSTEESPPLPNHIMMALRAFANLFSSPAGRTLALSSFPQIYALITTSASSSKDRNLLVAASTVYINYAVMFSTTSSQDFEPMLQIIDSLTKILTTHVDSEVVYRAMVALGTLLSIDKEVTGMAKDVYGVEKAVQTAVGKASDPRIKSLAGEIKELLK
jgi:phospholipase A-2-activating protein